MTSVGADVALTLIREALEGIVEPRRAATIIFEALEAGRRERLPDDAEGVLAFVRGPLSSIAERRAGHEAARELVERLDAVLASALRPSQLRGPVTVEVQLQGGPLLALMVSRATGLAVRLRTALGGERFGAAVADDVAKIGPMAEFARPGVVIIDAPEPLRTDAASLAAPLAAIAGRPPIVAWGSAREFPWLTSLATELGTRGSQLVTIDRADGIEPLLDLLRSRSPR